MNQTAISIFVNSAWNLVNFRSELVTALISNGYSVVVICPPSKYTEAIENLGCSVKTISFNQGGYNPFKDFVLVYKLFRILITTNSKYILTFTIKPNIYGSMAGMLARAKVVNNITGLGSTFISGGWLAKFIFLLYKISLFKSKVVFFQNNADAEIFIDKGIVRPETVRFLPGSGVNLDKFPFVPSKFFDLASSEKPFRFGMIARLLKDKGVVEYLEAAEIVKKLYKNVEFRLLGKFEPTNPSSISIQLLNGLIERSVVTYDGSTDKIHAYISELHCVVLPSYREGTSRALLEAAATGRPLIATNVPGCREVVDDGINGFLCNPMDKDDLADAMFRLISLPRDLVLKFGERSFDKACAEFKHTVVIDAYLKALEDIN